MLSGVSATSVRPASHGGWGGREYDGRYDAGYGTHEPQQPYPPQNPHGQYGDQRTQRYDPRGQRDQWR
jgi:hypothetical protein